MTVRLSPVILAGLLAVATPALAQTPAGGDTGGGVVRVAKPVTGQQVYEAVCQACHMADAKGGVGAGTIPALAANPRLAGAAYPISAVVLGKGGMPSLAGPLDDDQIAQVVTYIRTSFGNSYAKPVTASEVARIPHPVRGGGH
ncbi:c-type cytochrome [Caulobacter henricii]|uniref:Cytochrome C n=1 Tax=Caulobacter henricii TaxID=69395 RepID=A0A0P0P247_9CAUL|nr:cytochrome c [Caulobacter henricii]ALL14415.1 cytochrome C [Caulobacter henricii]